MVCFQLWQLLEEDLCLFQLNSTTVHKMVFPFDAEEFDWPVQSPELHPVQHLWDELQH